MSTGDRKHYTPHEDLTDLAVAIRDLDATSEALQIQIRDAIEALTIEMTTTKIEITTAQCPALDINHSGVDSCKVIDLTPSAALNPASIWFAMYMSLAALSPSGAGCQLHGIEVDFSGVDLTHDPDIDGISVKLPAAYAGGTEVAGYFSGDGRTVSLCTDAYALAISGAMQLDGIITGMNSLQCDLGTSINEFSIDGTLAGDSDDAVPTEQAVKTYADVIQADVDGFQDGLKDLTAIEVTQLKNIGVSTISPTQWGYLGALDQALTQASSPTFVGLTLTGAIATPTTITTSGDITCGADLVVNGGDVTISSSTETASLTVYNPLNDGNPIFNIGKDASDRFYIQTNFNAGTQELDGVTFISRSTGAGTNDGRFVFSPDNVIVLALDPRAGSPEGMIYAYGPIQFYNVESTPVIDINPNGTGSSNIIDITPTAALVAGSSWKGNYINIDSLDPATGAGCSIVAFQVDGLGFASTDGDAAVYGLFGTLPLADNSRLVYHNITEMTANKSQIALYSHGANVLSATATYRGVHIDWDDITRDANAPVLEGIRVELPASYTGFGTSFAGYFSGDGRSVIICDTTYALDVSGAVRVVGDVAVGNLITAGNVDGVDVSTFKTAYDTHDVADNHIAHSGVTITAGTGLSGGGTIAATRTINCDITQYTDALAIAAVVAENPLTLTNALLIGSIVAGTADYDAFLVSHAGTVKYRTGAQVLSDIGASATGHTHTHASTTGQTANDHHDESHNLASHSDVTISGAQVEDLTSFGSGNAQWINCPLEMWNPTAAFNMDSLGRVVNAGTGVAYVHYSVPLPTTRGGLKLYISGTRVSLADADADDYVASTVVRGYTDASYSDRDNDPTDKNAIQIWEDTSMGALDCSAYHVIKIQLACSDASAGQLDIQFVSVRYYYAV